MFSSNACGAYDFTHLTIMHAGQASPVGEIVLASPQGDIKIRSGSGFLLVVNGASDGGSGD